MKKCGLFLLGILLLNNVVFLHPQSAHETRENQEIGSLDDVALIVDDSDVVSLNKRDGKNHYERYMRACYDHKTGQSARAFESYKQIINQSHPLYVYDGFIRLLFDTGQFATIVNLWHQKKSLFEKTFKNSLDVKIIIAQACLYAGNQNEAEKLFTELNKQHPDNDSIAYYTAVSLMRNNNPQKVLTYIEDCLKRPGLRGKHFLFYFLMSKIYLQMQKHDQALTAINKSLELFPHFDQGLLFRAMLFEQQGKVTDAINGYERFLDTVGHDPEVEKQLVQLLFSQQRFSEAAYRLRRVGGKTPEYSFDLALLEFNGKKLEEALKSVDAALKQSPKFAKAKLLKLEILLALKQQDKALSLVQEWLSNEPDNLSVLHVLMLFKKAHIPGDKLVAVLEKTLKKTQSVLLHAALGDLCLELKRYEVARGNYQKAFKLAQDEAMKSKISYQIAYTLLKLNKKDEAKKQLKELVASSSYPAACNLLAYLNAKDRHDLPGALALVEKALDKQPNKPEFLDTKGYVLVQMGRKEEAVVIFKKALSYKPNSPGIQQHLKELNAQ